MAGVDAIQEAVNAAQIIPDVVISGEEMVRALKSIPPNPESRRWYLDWGDGSGILYFLALQKLAQGLGKLSVPGVPPEVRTTLNRLVSSIDRVNESQVYRRARGNREIGDPFMQSVQRVADSIARDEHVGRAREFARLFYDDSIPQSVRQDLLSGSQAVRDVVAMGMQNQCDAFERLA